MLSEKNVIDILPLNSERACLFHWNLETLIYTGPQDPTFFYIIFLYLSCVLIGLNYTGRFTIHLSPYCIYHIYSVFHVLLYPLSCEFVCCLCFLTVVQFNILILHARIRSHLISCMLSN